MNSNSKSIAYSREIMLIQTKLREKFARKANKCESEFR